MLALGIDPGTAIYFTLEERRFDIRITIADNGKGLQDDLKKTLFNPFVTGNAARTSGGGTGLVIMTKNLINRHE